MSDDKSRAAIHPILQVEMQQQQFPTEVLNGFYDLRTEYLEGNTKPIR